MASHYDHQNVALLLLEKGASVHATAKNGHTPLHIAAKKNQVSFESSWFLLLRTLSTLNNLMECNIFICTNMYTLLYTYDTIYKLSFPFRKGGLLIWKLVYVI